MLEPGDHLMRVSRRGCAKARTKASSKCKTRWWTAKTRSRDIVLNLRRRRVRVAHHLLPPRDEPLRRHHKFRVRRLFEGSDRLAYCCGFQQVHAHITLREVLQQLRRDGPGLARDRFLYFGLDGRNVLLAELRLDPLLLLRRSPLPRHLRVEVRVQATVTLRRLTTALETTE